MILYIENPEEFTHTHTHLGLNNRSENSQDTRSVLKNQLYFYALAMRNPKIE